MEDGRLKGLWRRLWSPSARWSLGTLLFTGAALGVALWAGFSVAMDASSTDSFCISCHEMRNTVYKELAQTIHHRNRTGVQAGCADCHVPNDWGGKLARKIMATREVYHKVLGTIDTPEKFEQHRRRLAEKVWRELKENDSRDCRNCHAYGAMDFSKQQEWSAPVHQAALKSGQTCIDCHKGIAHKLPQ